MKLLKIGELAQEINRLPSTVHFYNQQGLIHPQALTRGGYRLYDKTKTIKRIKQIEKLQIQKRWTIEEIKIFFKNRYY